MTLRRPATTLTAAALFIGLAVTGLMGYLLPFSQTIADVHTLFGLGFLIAAGVHISNNLRPLLLHLKRRWLALAGSAVALVVLLGGLAHLPPFGNVLETGYALRKTAGVEEGEFQVITTRVSETGVPLRIEVRAGPHYESPPQPLFAGITYTSVPQVAFWAEALDGSWVQTLYVTKKLTDSSFLNEDFFSDEVVRRPEALPVWTHRRGVRASDGLLVPEPGSTELDGLTAATPSGHYDLKSLVADGHRRFRVFMEINRSYDFNAWWHPQRFPDDPVYSGTGASGQPSLVYMAEVDLDSAERFHLLRPIGRGHHSGQDGEIHADLTGVDTALELVNRVLVQVGPAAAQVAAR